MRQRAVRDAATSSTVVQERAVRERERELVLARRGVADVLGRNKKSMGRKNAPHRELIILVPIPYTQHKKGCRKIPQPRKR